jgi:hypothetical protein
MSDKTGYDRELQDKTCGRLFKRYNKAVEWARALVHSVSVKTKDYAINF